jgi:TRAP-type mannitol/chloroaromatic compound transport system substrate-binding protein
VSQRRKFIKQAGATALAGVGGLMACDTTIKNEQTGPYINFNKTYRWKMTTTWPPNFPVVGQGCQMIADWVKQMSGGRMEIIIYGGGELIPALEGFDAVSNGAIEMNHGAAYYWAGKLPASPIFATVPFGMNTEQMEAWLLSGGGQALWEELYAPYDLLPMVAGNTGVQMGGWFNKEINSITDIKGLKMRIPGLGGKVFSRSGGTPVLVSGGEIYTNLERGVIDATEWIGPYHDYIMGFQQVAKYYYYPGWHEPGPVLEMLVNKTKFLDLPVDLQEIIRTACLRVNSWMTAEFNTQNSLHLTKLINEGKTVIKPFPSEVLKVFKENTRDVMEELATQDSSAGKAWRAFSAFKSSIAGWMDKSQGEFYRQLM